MNSSLQRIPPNESDQVEFKTKFSDEVIVSLVAFANNRGGTVYVGVADNGEVIGIQTGKETIAQWLNEIKNKTAPVLMPDLENIEVNGKTVVAITLSEYPIKPVSTKGRYYTRNGNANLQLTVAEVVNMHLKTLNSSWDAFPDQQHLMEDISLEKVQAAIDRRNKVQPLMQDDPLTFLHKSGLIRDEKMTHAAFLLFHKDDSYLSTIELGRFQTEILIKDSARSKSDVLTQIDQVIDFVKKHINLEVIITGEAQNTQRWQYPLEAIREIVINMVLHRNYRSTSDSIVKVFNNRIEFYNPGRLPENITIEDLLTNHYRSTPRNKLMADFLKDIGIIEKYGSGIQRILDLFRNAQLPDPYFVNISEGFMVTIYASPESPSSVYKLREGSNEGLNAGLNEGIKSLLVQVKLHPGSQTNNLSDFLNSRSTKTIERQVGILIKMGLIEHRGSKKTGGYWEILN